MIDLEIYEVFTDGADKPDHKHIGYFTKEEDAKKAAKGRGILRDDAWIKEVTIKVYESWMEYHSGRQLK